jgi:hypothetical protein
MASAMDVSEEPLKVKPILVEPLTATEREEVRLFRARPTWALTSASERLMRLMDDSVVGAALYQLTPLQVMENFALSTSRQRDSENFTNSAKEMYNLGKSYHASKTVIPCGLYSLTMYAIALLMARYDAHGKPFLYAQFIDPYAPDANSFGRIMGLVYYSEWYRQHHGVGIPILIEVAADRHATMALWIPTGSAQQWIYIHIDTSYSDGSSIKKYEEYISLAHQTLSRCMNDMAAATGLTFPAVKQLRCEQPLQHHGTCESYSFFLAYDFVRDPHDSLQDWCAKIYGYTHSDVFEQRIIRIVKIASNILARVQKEVTYGLRSNPDGVPNTYVDMVNLVRSQQVAQFWSLHSHEMYILLADSMTKTLKPNMIPRKRMDESKLGSGTWMEFESSNPVLVKMVDLLDQSGCNFLCTLSPHQVTENFFMSSGLNESFGQLEQMSSENIDLVTHMQPTMGQCGGLTAAKFVLMISNHYQAVHDRFVYIQFMQHAHNVDQFAMRLRCAVLYAAYRRLDSGVAPILFIHTTDWHSSSVMLLVPVGEKQQLILNINTGPPAVSFYEVRAKFESTLAAALAEIETVLNVKYEIQNQICDLVVDQQNTCVASAIFVAFDFMNAQYIWRDAMSEYRLQCGVHTNPVKINERMANLIATLSKIYASVPNQSTFAKLRSFFIEDLKQCVKCGNLVDIVNQIRSDAMAKAWAKEFETFDTLMRDPVVFTQLSFL